MQQGFTGTVPDNPRCTHNMVLLNPLYSKITFHPIIRRFGPLPLLIPYRFFISLFTLPIQLLSQKPSRNFIQHFVYNFHRPIFFRFKHKFVSVLPDKPHNPRVTSSDFQKNSNVLTHLNKIVEVHVQRFLMKTVFGCRKIR